jgi:transcriptional regulator GlxA family with amidase domain
MHRMAILAIPDVVALQVAVPGQVFGHRDQRENYSVSVCAEFVGAVRSTTGFSIQADVGLSALETADTIVVPGFWPPSTPSENVVDSLRMAAARGSRIVSFCTGSFALAEAGLLDGRSATTHWQEMDEFARRFRRIDLKRDVLYVDEGQIVTSAGDSAAIDLCLHLLRLDQGAAAADAVAKRMVSSEPRPADHAQFPSHRLGERDWSLARTKRWAADHLADRLTVADMSEHASVAPRTFARRFKAETGETPLQWLTAIRLLEARRLLEVTNLTMDDIAQRCGLGTAANLRIVMLHGIGRVPSDYRSEFRQQEGS